jgi:DNA-directed RNA polymerase specialized sigma24 family protein
MKGSGYSSEELFEQCFIGNEEAWLAASQYVQSIVLRDCWQMGERDRNEIVNETLLYYLSRGLDQIKHPRAFRMLLKLKAKALAIDRRRKDALMNIQEPHYEDDNESSSLAEYFPPSYPDCERNIFNREALQICKTIIDSLKKECRELLPLYFSYKVLGHGVGKLAEDQEKPLGTIAASVHRCLKKLYLNPQIVMLKQEVSMG